MANYVRNRVTFYGEKERLEEVLRFLGSHGNPQLDFNVIVPEPKEITDSEGLAPEEDVVFGEYLATGKTTMMNDEFMRKLGGKYLNKPILGIARNVMLEACEKTLNEKQKKCRINWYYNQMKYGYSDWYSWRQANWGTKANYGGDFLDDIFILDAEDNTNFQYNFDTAWTSPVPVLKALSKKFPDIKLEVNYADENMGFDCGTYELKKGIMVKKTVYKDSTWEAISHSLMVWNQEYLEDYVVEDEDGLYHIDFEKAESEGGL